MGYTHRRQKPPTSRPPPLNQWGVSEVSIVRDINSKRWSITKQMGVHDPSVFRPQIRGDHTDLKIAIDNLRNALEWDDKRMGFDLGPVSSAPWVQTIPDYDAILCPVTGMKRSFVYHWLNRLTDSFSDMSAVVAEVAEWCGAPEFKRADDKKTRTITTKDGETRTITLNAFGGTENFGDYVEMLAYDMREQNRKTEKPMIGSTDNSKYLEIVGEVMKLVNPQPVETDRQDEQQLG